MIIYGASGHGKVICDIIQSQGIYNSIAFVDDADKGERFYNHDLYHSSMIDLHSEFLIIGIGNNEIRKKIASYYKNFETAIHASSQISLTCKIGKGTVVMANCCCNADTIVGEHVILNTACSVDHDCVIKDFAHISPNATLAGGVTVGEGTHIGIGASIIQGIKIGKFATIGAGSVVIKDVPDGATVVGCPAKIIKTKKL